jgi:mono/diheme cytochrome c family protein
MKKLPSLIAVLGLSGLAASGFAQAQQPAKKNPAVERGAYLVNLGGCNDCHTPKTFGPQGPQLDATRLLSGHPAGEKMPTLPAGVLGPGLFGAVTTPGLTGWVGPWGTSYAANLTPDATGLKGWTAEIFIKTLRTGKHMGDGRPILPPMPWEGIGHMTDKDLKDVFAYLQSLKPVANTVPVPQPPAGAK